MTLDGYLPAVIGGLVAVVSPVVLKPLLLRRAILDVPNERSSHDRPTLRGAGLAQLLGIITAAAVVISLRDGLNQVIVIVVVLYAGVAASLLGLWDDLRGGRGPGVLVRAGLQLTISVIAVSVLAGTLATPLWFVVPATVFAAAYINIANFMDGINGISSMHGAIVGLGFFAMGTAADSGWLQVVGLILCIVFLAFLPWNILGAGMFLGDVGSYLLGALAGMCAIGATFGGVPVVVAASPVSIYLADTLVTLARRAARGEPVLRAHRSHAYQRLTGTGLTHLSVSILVALFTAASVMVGLLVLTAGLDQVVAGIVIAVVCGIYLALPRLRGSVLPPRPTFSLKEIEEPQPIAQREGFRPRRWVVLGASGFIGGTLAAHLESLGHEVVKGAAPRLSLATREDACEVVHYASVSDREDLVARFRGADVVINAAGLATPDAPAGDDLYGANSLLPALVAIAAQDAKVPRVIHLSTAAVQGRRQSLDETVDASPFSPYSHSKALGERAFLTSRVPGGTDLLVIRATSVQGPGRRTTETLRRIAQSPLATVAAPGTQPSVVSSVHGLVDFTIKVGSSTEALGAILLQPWEGYSVQDALRVAGGNPRVLPRWLCVMTLACANAVGYVVPEVAGGGRRLEMMWFGQGQKAGSGAALTAVPRASLQSVLAPRGDSA